MFRFDIDKLKPQYVNTDFILPHYLQTPILEALDHIISDNRDEVNMDPPSDYRLQGHRVRVSLGKKDAHPAPIYVQVDERLVLQYTYMDNEFLLRTLPDFVTPGDAQELDM